MNKLSRYMGEQRMYVIFVDATSANGLFEQGLNAILVSRPTLLNSKLNTSIFNFNPSSPGEMEDFKDATFNAYDNSKASQKGALVGAVTVTLSGDKATKLLNEFILINASGGKIAEARKLTTAQVHQLGIHPVIMSLVAQQGFEMSDTGALPKTLAGAIWEGLTGLVAGVADVLYQGLVAIGNFFASLGDAVASWGQKLLGAINTVADTVKAAVQAVLDALNAIVKWVVDQAKKILNSIVSGFINFARVYIEGISSVLNEIVLGYKSHIENGSEFNQAEYTNRLVLATFTSPGFIATILILITIGIAIEIATTPYLTLLGFLLPLIGGLISGLIIGAIGISASGSNDGTFGISSNTGPNELELILYDLLGFEKPSGRCGSRQADPCDFNHAMAVILFGALGAVFGFLGKYAPSGGAYSVYGGAAAVFGILLIAAGAFYPRGSITGNALFAFGMVVAVVGLVFSILGTIGSTGGWLILGLIGIALSIIGIIIAIDGFVACP